MCAQHGHGHANWVTGKTEQRSRGGVSRYGACPKMAENQLFDLLRLFRGPGECSQCQESGCLEIASADRDSRSRQRIIGVCKGRRLNSWLEFAGGEGQDRSNI